MKVIGLTGTIAAGKSTVAEFLQNFGLPVFDADSAVHHMYQSNANVVNAVRNLCPQAFRVDFGIDRTVLRQYIIQNKNFLSRLERLIRGYIKPQIVDFISMSTHSKVVLEIPLLFEGGWDKYCDYTISVSAERDLRIARAIKDRNIDPALFDTLDSRQLSNKEKDRRATFVLYNNFDKDDLLQQLENVLHAINTQTPGSDKERAVR